MKIEDVNISETITRARGLLSEQTGLSKEFRTLFELILHILEVLAPRLQKKTSKNSHLPPSMDPNREKVSKAGTGKKPGGQPGRKAVRLEPFASSEVDDVVSLSVDRRTLPRGRSYRLSRTVSRQVVDVVMSRRVTEYRLEVLVDEHGKEYMAKAPDGVRQPIQYGSSVKALCVYMNQYQLLPYGRVEAFFRDQVGIPLSQGSLFNFNQEAHTLLGAFEDTVTHALQQASVLHLDETGVNINGTRYWLHTACNTDWTYLMAHPKRGKEAMDAMGILPHFHGVAMHDHWKAYFRYACKHALCHAHHLRELQAVSEQAPEHQWPTDMKALLQDMNKAVDQAGGALAKKDIYRYRTRYRDILEKGHLECPPPEPPPHTAPKKRGRPKKSKERNLLERFIQFEKECLRFLWVPDLPFTNNQGERELRMAKVQQKISGCFKTLDSANIHARIRSYCLSVQKQGHTPHQAIQHLFEKKKSLI